MKDWWSDLEPLSEEDDGQTITKIYSRRFRGQWQYAIVTTFDDGEPLKTLVLSAGKVQQQEG